jgi:hypothetical protein
MEPVKPSPKAKPQKSQAKAKAKSSQAKPRTKFEKRNQQSHHCGISRRDESFSQVAPR